MNINWEPIIAAVFAVINAVAVYVLVPYIKSKTTAAQQETLAQVIDILVAAAEQLFKAPGAAPRRKRMLSSLLRSRALQ